MNTQEKFLVMAEIWDSLNDQDLREFTPKWHLDILDKREKWQSTPLLWKNLLLKYK